jgi:hypothetical protein
MVAIIEFLTVVVAAVVGTAVGTAVGATVVAVAVGANGVGVAASPQATKAIAKVRSVARIAAHLFIKNSSC